MGFSFATPGESTSTVWPVVERQMWDYVWVKLHKLLKGQRPKLYGRDTDAILAYTGGQVTARIHQYNDVEKRLMLKVRPEVDDAVINVAEKRALELIAYNKKYAKPRKKRKKTRSILFKKQ